MRETEGRVRRALRDQSPPDAAEAEERAWRVIQAAYAETDHERPRKPWRRQAVRVAIAVGLIGILVSPAGATVRHWVKDAVNPGRENASPALTSLPAPGRVLVESREGAWVVHRDGSKRLLGEFRNATWSPRGLFVAATTKHQLLALDSDGGVRWTLARSGPVSLPSWNSPDGFRIAYLSGGSLRVVNGDGSGDHLLAKSVAKVAPAWMPGPAYVLVFARKGGGVTAVAADSGRRVFTTRRGSAPIGLQWSTDGKRLLVVRSSAVENYNPKGRLLWRRSVPSHAVITDARLSPDGHSVALLTRANPPTERSQLLLSGTTGTRSLFAGPGRFSDLAWSPNGRWLLLGWQSADQWLFLSPKQPKRIVAVSNISSQFAPGAERNGGAFPRVQGWCCASLNR